MSARSSDVDDEDDAVRLQRSYVVSDTDSVSGKVNRQLCVSHWPWSCYQGQAKPNADHQQYQLFTSRPFLRPNVLFFKSGRL